MTAHPIPDAALDGRIAIVGITGSGKSTTAKGGVERLLHQGRRVCVVDLLDGWWGLRLKRDGKTPAFPVAIFGGRHGDVALAEHAGALLGRSVAEAPDSTIVSLSELDSDAARRRFALAFFDALHRHNRAPLHLVIDEADFYAPQNPAKDGPGPLLLNRVKEIAARGRQRGFRCWLITQRPAKLSKDVLSQADTLVAMQLTASQDRKAIEGWIGDQSDMATGRQILATLPRLKRGQGVLWAPRLGILEPTHFPLPDTYDSSRTPEYGEATPDIALAPLDLSALRTKLAAVEAEAAANDPAALKKRIAALERECDAAKAAKPMPAADPAAIDAARAQSYDEGYSSGLEYGLNRGVALGRGEAADELARALKPILDRATALAQLPPADETPAARAPGVARPAVRVAPVAPRARTSRPPGTYGTGPGETMPRAERRILTALAQYPDGRTKTQVAVLTGYAATGGGFLNALGALRTRGWIEGRDTLQATAAGVAALGAFEPLPHGDALLQHWRGQLGKAERSILDVLAARHPGTMTRDELAERAGYAPDGGGFNNAIGRLRTLELIGGDRSALCASDDLFG